MAEIGQIAAGTVMRIMPYGALVRLDDGSSGLVHISEIDNTFVSNVAEYLEIGARVVVKVLAQKEAGKLEFSLKQAKGVTLDSLPPRPTASAPDYFAPENEARVASPMPGGQRRESRAAFDEKMRDFLADSGERLDDLKRHHNQKLNRRQRD